MPYLAAVTVTDCGSLIVAKLNEEDPSPFAALFTPSPSMHSFQFILPSLILLLVFFPFCLVCERLLVKDL